MVRPPYDSSVSLRPVFSGRYIYFQRHLQVPYRFHDYFDKVRNRFHLFRRGLEDQFIMHRKQHGGFKVFLGKRFINPYHGKFDEICRSSLNGRIDGGPFGKPADGWIWTLDVRQQANAVEQGADLSGISGFLDSLLDE